MEPNEALRVKDWNKHYECNRTRALIKLAWVPVPNRMDGDGYLDLVSDRKTGAAHLGCWLAMIEVASRCHPRGTLVRDNGIPHTPESLERITRLPARTIEDAITKLLFIGWLEVIPWAAQRQADAPEPHEGAVIAQEGAGIPQGADTNPVNERKERKERTEGTETAGAWQEFQNLYPECKRVRVEPACQAYFGRINSTPGEHQKLMEGLQRHLDCDQWRRSLRDNGGRYIPNMEKFISEGLYEDHPPAFNPEGDKREAPCSRPPHVLTYDEIFKK